MSFYANKDTNTKSVIINALKEDVGIKDITTDSVIPKNRYAKAVILAKEPCVVCGLGVARAVFKQQDKVIKFTPCAKDGDFVKKGKIIARVCGNARSILTAERVALNFLSHLCGISTKTREFAQKVKPYKAKIMDTRKTIPGLRILEKYAVRMGGGFNHRLSLDEMIMVKDNHIKVIGDRFWVIGFKGKGKEISSKVKIEIEVKTLKELKKALNLKPDIVMLDNMSIEEMRKAVQLRNHLSPNAHHLTPKIEASGRGTLENVKKIASTSVDMISIGALTHSVHSVDISLEIQ